MNDDPHDHRDDQPVPEPERPWTLPVVVAIVVSLAAAALGAVALVLAVGNSYDTSGPQPAPGGGAAVAAGNARSPAPRVPVPTTAKAASCPASAGLTSSASQHGIAPATSNALTVDAREFYFTPTCFTGVPAGTVTLTVHNTGGALHNVSIPSQGIDEDVAPGKTIKVNVEAGPEAFQYFCKYHKTSGMVGAFVPAP